MKNTTLLLMIIILGIAGGISFFVGVISILLATITAIMGSFTIHSYITRYHRKPENQRKKFVLVAVGMYFCYTVVFGVFTIYMLSRLL